MLYTADLHDDVAALKAILVAARLSEADKDVLLAHRDEQLARKDERIERLWKLVAAFKQAAFERNSEKTDPAQFDLALEDVEAAMAVIHAEDEADVPGGNRLVHHCARVSTKSPLGAALAYIAKYWDDLKLFLTNGRIEIDNNSVERTIRPIALNRKNALFAGTDTGPRTGRPSPHASISSMPPNRRPI